MSEKYNVYLISDSTGETLDRIFLSLKSQFSNFEYNKKEFVFIRTEQQVDKIIKECENLKNNTKCPNEQVVALLSVIASNFATSPEKKGN